MVGHLLYIVTKWLAAIENVEQMLQRKITHPILGEILLQKRLQSKKIRILVSASKGIRVSLPFFCSYSAAIKFIENNVEKIASAIKRSEREKLTDKIEINKISKEEFEERLARAHKILPARLEKLSGRMNEIFEIKNNKGEVIRAPFAYNSLAIKNNRSNWGSCSGKRNINLNLHLVALPEELMDFVIIHELCHLVYLNHSKEFHKLLNEACGGKEKILNRKLRGYRLS